MQPSRFTNNSDPTQAGRAAYVAEPGTELLPHESRQLYILTAGNLEVVFAGYKDEGEPDITNKILITGVTPGQTFDWAVAYLTAGTTAEVLVVY